ncbi:cysteine proteinase [Hyphopichia burtonii NRRL Y-1933]|uniref:Cysteine proteinase n=1 Tax=Hyphopichia burtonii NRRL Y-1933 TaxID=984485 RepID=A0A1E4RSE3_9ASCO|nr:cysteine proteinase [Hyphopichia burtonii NRRL Y-1933]ODV70224.1 cysteine proteinase [Hyphopichia burtonii NRRL Y-1933]
MSSRKTVPGKGITTNGYHNDLDYENGEITQEVTPPPDNFGHIKSCQHIKSVLDSKAHDNVLITYKQAVNITVTNNKNYSNKKFTMKKDGSSILSNKLQDLKLKSLKCTDCSLNNFYNNFICLQCPHVGCFHNSNHAYNHYKLNQHLFAIDSYNGLLYCFSCGDYVNNSKLEKIRLKILTNDDSVEKFNKIESNNDNNEEYLLPSKQAMNGLKGFINLGSTCFMSCILQSFIHNPILKYQFFNNDYHFLNCDSNHDYMNGLIDENNACITCSIDNIFKGFFTANNPEGFGMTNLLMTAWFKKKSLAGFQEQDAHEFWQFLLNEFHLDYERINKKLNANHLVDDDFNCKCITHTTFSGQLNSSIKCLNCDSITETIDPLIDLSLEMNHLNHLTNPTLYDCLDLFTKDEKLDVMYTCQHCETKSKAIKSLKIKKLPPVLSIQLKRFEHNLYNDVSSKIETPVKTPLFLNLTKYTSDVSDDEIDQNKVYELFTVVSHIGSVNTGHYIVMIKNGDGKWFRFDDSVISIVSQDEVMNTNAYLLFYITHRI